MAKQENKQAAHELDLIKSLLKRIKTKLWALGFSNPQINQKISQIVSRVLKIKSTQERDMQKVVLNKLSSHERSHKNHNYLLAVELDLYLNSIYDNYQSETEQQTLKLQHIANGREPNKNQSHQKRHNFQKINFLNGQQLRQHRNQSRRSILYKDSLLQGYRNRRTFQKPVRPREIKLQYLNAEYDL